MRSRQVLINHLCCAVIAAPILFTTPAFAESTPEFVANEVIVQYKKSTTVNKLLAHKSSMRRTPRKVILAEAKGSKGRGELALVKLATPVSSAGQLAQTLQQIRQDPDVEFAEPNWILHKLDTKLASKIKPRHHFPNDKYFHDGETWGMYGSKTVPANPYGTRVSEVWYGQLKPLNCSNVYVGVIDEGIMLSHPDLKGSIWVNRYDPVDGKDNDGNGYIDDRNGWDFYHNDRTIYHRDQDFHGTHIAGIISATGDNGIGVPGMCWKAKLISAKFLGPNGGDTANAIKAIDYITDLKVRHRLNIIATNNSWGGGGYSQAMVDAIKRAEAQNILFVAAAGNDGTNNDDYPLYPASYPNANIISVAAIGPDGEQTTISNYGASSVDIAAPGNGIISTVPDVEGKPWYDYDGGTSMAAPFVTGAVALLAHKHGTANAKRIKRAILNGAMPSAALAGKSATGGRLDIPRMLRSDSLYQLRNLLPAPK